VLAKLRAEHDQVLGSDPNQAADTLRQFPYKLSELVYTTGVVKETLRLHAPATTFRRGSPNFDLVDHVDDGRRYPTTGFVLSPGATGIHAQEDLWPDVKAMIPERYLAPRAIPCTPVKGAWRGFGYGNTACIGQELAMMEMKLVLVFTARELDFEFPWEMWDKQRYVHRKARKHRFLAPSNGQCMMGTDTQ
jgi:cytochrome P450